MSAVTSRKPKREGAPYTRREYHSVRAPWRSNRSRPMGFKVGIELEIEHPTGYEEVLDSVPRFQKGRPIFERDASLSHHGGVEIVFPPYSPSTLEDPRSNFRRTLQAVEDSGALAANNCGMHINVNTTGWTRAERGRFACIFFSIHNDFYERFSGRPLRYYCSRGMFTPGASVYTILDCIHSSHEYAVGARENRLECRFPAATTDHRVISKIVFFLQCVEKYAKASTWESYHNASYNPGSWNYTIHYDKTLELIEFIEANIPNSKRKKELVELLRETYPEE